LTELLDYAKINIGSQGCTIVQKRRNHIMFGMNDAFHAEKEAKEEAVNLLLEVAEGKKNREDVQKWLEEKYPELCHVTTTTEKKKW
jgi:hypothetical protein